MNNKDADQTAQMHETLEKNILSKISLHYKENLAPPNGHTCMCKDPLSFDKTIF